MIPTLRAAVLAGCAVLALAAPLSVQAQATAWPQATSDLKADPAVRFGQLPNGMRYAILHNATPVKQTSIRLRIGSGSLEEKDDQQGLAHFLEHMAFKGSAHMPEGEMLKVLQRHGLAFGPDTNASTGYTQTVYQLDLPENDAESVDLGLMLMRETGSELTLDGKAMQPERGVVQSEERVRDTPGYEASRKRQAFVMKGQLVPNRSPIGKVEILQNAPVSRLRAYYEANYRPERATLVVVGDIDVDAVEAKIKARFGDWKGVGPATAEPVLGAVAPRGLEGLVIVQPGSPPGISVAWTRPHDPTPDTRAKRIRNVIDTIALGIVNRRMARLATQDKPPFVSAGIGRSDQLKSIRETTLAVTPKGDDWQGALTAADGVRRQALQYGVQPAEIAQEIVSLHGRLRGAVTSAATRSTPQLAQQIVGDVDSEQVFTSPQESLAVFDEAVKGLKPEQVNDALHALFEGAYGPLVVMVTPTPLPGGEAALLAGFKTAEAAPVTAPEIEAAKPWPYTNFGAQGSVVEQHSVPDLGVTYVRFANGVRLAFKPTSYRKDQVLIAFNMPGGLLTQSKTKPSAVWASAALTSGGFKQFTAEETDRALNGRDHNATARVGEQAFVLAGVGRRNNLDTEMQVLTAYLAAPGWRASAFERALASANRVLDVADATPSTVLALDRDVLLHSGDQRWANPRKAEVSATSLSDIRAIWDPALSQGPVEVVMVGDISLERAIEVVAKTVGALPKRGPAPSIPADAKVVHFPAPTAQPVRLTHKGRADQAIAYIAWPTTDYYASPREARAVELATQVMEGRLIERVRVAEGATYSPAASDRQSDLFPGYGVISASVETPPARIDGFFKAVADITADLRNTPISADELERARKPRIEQTERAQQTNEYWMGRLAGAQDDLRRLETARNAVADYQAVSIADIQAAARKYLRDETAYKIVVTAEAAKP